MIFKKINLAIICVVLLAWCKIINSPAWAQPTAPLKLDASRIRWTHLSFHAKNFWVEVSTDIQLKSLPAPEVEALLLASPRGVPIKPAKPNACQMTINTTIDPVFRPPVKINYQVWFNPEDAAVLGRIRLRRGEDDLIKIYRFTEQGVFRQRKEPKDSKEISLEPEKWTNVQDSFYPYNLADLGCPIVSGRLLLVYIISAVDIAKRDQSQSICVFGKEQLHRVRFRNEGLHPVAFKHVVKDRQAEVQKTGTVKALKIAVTAEPMEPDLKDPEDFSFLGLHKDIAIYVDPTSRLPIQVSGTIPMVGNVSLKLSEVRLRQGAD
jgi:hypothetical protein